MAGLWQFVVPADCTNLFTNPSGETNTTGFTVNGGSVARTVGAGRKGAYGLVHTPSSGTSSGMYQAASLVSGTAYIFAVYVKGAVGIPYEISFADNSGNVLGTPTTFTGDGAWHRYSVAYTTVSTATHRCYVMKNNSASVATIASDGWMLYAGTELQTYVDGDQSGCVWTQTAHASTSVRYATSRAGGIIRNLDDYALYVTALSGYGEPPSQVNVTEYGSLPGALYDSSRAQPRSLQLTLKALGTSLSNLHSRRDALIAAINPDATPLQEPFQVRYLGLGEGKERLLRAVYDEGLGGDRPEGFSESIPLRLLATDPIWYADGEAAASLSQGTLSVGYAAKRAADGTWSNLGGGFDAAITSIAYDDVRNLFYFGGSFTTAGGVSAARIAKYDPVAGTFTAMGTGANNDVNCILVDTVTGDVYAGGSFTSIGGVTTTGIARWDGTWHALGTGASGGGVFALVWDASRNLIAAGAFTSMGGVANTSRIAKWSGSAWSALGTGVNGTARALAVGPNGFVYVGGDFTTGNSVTLNGIGYWNGTTFVALGSGVASSVNVEAIAFAPDGTLYLGGDFASAGGVTVGKIAAWNGAGYSALGSGLAGSATAEPFSIVVRPNGAVVVSCSLQTTTFGGFATADPIATWTGSVWLPLDIDLPGYANCTDSLIVGDDLYIAGGFTGTATVGTVATVTNDGTAAAYPRIIISGPSSGTARLYALTNYTTKDVIVFSSGLTIAAGEVMTLDLTPGRRSFRSTLQGNIIGKIAPGCNLGSWRLHKGANSIVALVGAATVAVTLVWPLRYRSADGGAS